MRGQAILELMPVILLLLTLISLWGDGFSVSAILATSSGWSGLTREGSDHRKHNIAEFRHCGHE